MTDTITKEMQDAYWDEWQQTQDHWLALAEARKAAFIEAAEIADREGFVWITKALRAKAEETRT